jgi:hypothetical protein
MEMIGHHAIRNNAHGNPVASQPNQLDKCLVIAGLMKHFALRVAAIDDMIAEVAYRGAGRAWHNPVYLGQCL